MRRSPGSISAFALLSIQLLAQVTSQSHVAPAAHAATDANAYLWLAGASNDVRQQTLVGASHLAPLAGRQISTIEFRRSAANEVYVGGAAHLRVTLSIAPRAPIGCERTFAANCGPSPVVVFAGTVTLPTSPAVVNATEPWTPVPVNWAAANVVRIQFQQPFLYAGGTLCIDIVGRAIAGQTANWWMADAAFEDIAGSVATVGSGCGTFGGPSREWSHVVERTLLPGAHAHFMADGPPGGIGIAAFGAAASTSVPLPALGLHAPGCSCHLDLGAGLTTVVATFVQDQDPRFHGWGTADVFVRVPPSPWVFGLQMTTQWLELTQPATSNAIRWTIAPSIPTLDMALLEGHPLEAAGTVSVDVAHVLRFEHQAP